MVKVMADVFMAASVLLGLASAAFWWWSAHLQSGRSIGWNPTIKEIDRKTMKANAFAAVLTGLSITAQAVATVLGHLVTP